MTFPPCPRITSRMKPITIAVFSFLGITLGIGVFALLFFLLDWALKRLGV